MQLQLTSSTTGRKKSKSKNTKRGKLERASWFTALGLVLLGEQIIGSVTKLKSQRWTRVAASALLFVFILGGAGLYGFSYYRNNINQPQQTLNDLYLLQNVSDKVFLTYSNAQDNLSSMVLSAKQITTGSGWQNLSAQTVLIKSQLTELKNMAGKLQSSDQQNLSLPSMPEFESQLTSNLEQQTKLVDYIDCVATKYVKIFEQLNILSENQSKLPSRPKSEEVKNFYGIYENVVAAKRENLQSLETCWSGSQETYFDQEFLDSANAVITQSRDNLNRTASIIDEILVTLQPVRNSEYQKKLEQLEQSATPALAVIQPVNVAALIEKPYAKTSGGWAQLTQNHESVSAELNNLIADTKTRLPKI